MKIYIVTDGYYSDYHIEAVFTDKRQAEIYCGTHQCDNIEEYEADQHQFDSDMELKLQWNARIYDGVVSEINKYYTFYNVESIEEDIVSTVSVIITTDTSVDEDMAQKIVLDKYYQWKYEQMS